MTKPKNPSLEHKMREELDFLQHLQKQSSRSELEMPISAEELNELLFILNDNIHVGECEHHIDQIIPLLNEHFNDKKVQEIVAWLLSIGFYCGCNIIMNLPGEYESELENLENSFLNVSADEEEKGILSRVYAWMTTGMLVTGAISYYVGNSPELVHSIISGFYFLGLIIAQVLAVIFLSVYRDRNHVAVAAITYLIFSALTGLTLSVLFVQFAHENIAMAFAATAIAFAGLSLFGYVTKRDLSAIGSFCIMGLFGLIGITLLSLFVPSLMGELPQIIISGAGVIIFAGLTAYDTQKLKVMSINSDSKVDQLAIDGALELYLDFFNLFIDGLRLSGGKK